MGILQEQHLSFPIPKELLPFVKELSELYSHHTQGAIAKTLQELIANLKADPNFLYSPVAYTQVLPDSPDEDNNLKSWEDLLNFTVYVDAEIYSHEDRGVIAEPELSPAEVIVVTHQEATEAYIQGWSDVAEKMAKLPNDVFTRDWSTSEVAKMLNCSAESLRKAKTQKRLPLTIGNFLVDCVGQVQRKLTWSIRLK